jgi:hypothetical protein
MKIIIRILTVATLAATAFGQQGANIPNLLNNTRNQLNTAAQQNAAKQNAAYGATQGNAPKVGAAPSAQANSKPVPVRPVVKVRGPVAKQAMTPQASPKPVEAKKAQEPVRAVAIEDTKAASDTKPDAEKKINLAGHRDPFVSPVRNHAVTGSGCSTGKRCLAIEQVNLRGVVRSESGMIAIVTNSLDKAYFLHESDPVFNGYVVKITGDSVVFQQSFEDKMGKPLTREVVKRISVPAV